MKPFIIIPTIKSLRMWLGIAGLLIMWSLRIPISETIKAMGNWRAVATYIEGYGTLGPVVLSLLVIAQVFIAFIPGHALVIASGYIYGTTLTILVVTTSAIIGSEIAFWLARKYGRPLIYRLTSLPTIERWDHLAGNRGGMFYFFTLILPFIPNDMMCYVAGLGKVSRKQFTVANIAARLLSTIAMTLIGSFELHPPRGFWFLFLGGLGMLYLGWGYYNDAFRVFRSKSTFARTASLWISKAYQLVFGLRYQIHGLENLPPGPKILAANHPCASDAILLPPIFKKHDVIGLAEAGQFNNPVIGWLMTHGGHIPVHPKNSHKTINLVIQALCNGKTILIFPEGSLSSECNGSKARSGAIRLSLATNVPIIPIGIHVAGSDTINLRWQTSDRGHGGRFQIRGAYSVCIGRPWKPQQKTNGVLKPLEIHELTRDLMTQINALVQQAAKEEVS